jgi:hypothetical protein
MHPVPDRGCPTAIELKHEKAYRKVVKKRTINGVSQKSSLNEKRIIF